GVVSRSARHTHGTITAQRGAEQCQSRTRSASCGECGTALNYRIRFAARARMASKPLRQQPVRPARRMRWPARWRAPMQAQPVGRRKHDRFPQG
ncbi:MAG: hypothetical protein ACK55Z_12765, partial [bacterium]